MDYSSKLQKLFKKEKISIGDLIEVDGKKGTLMPKSVGDENVIILKLDTGYNIGIEGNKIKRLGPSLQTHKNVQLNLAFDKTKPSISIISTGGTITSKIDYKTGGVISLMKPEELLQKIPELMNIVNIRNIFNPFTKMSEDIDKEDWVILAKSVEKELQNSDGVIILHGTDTLHYTAAALSFMLNVSKPVILVGSQRSSDRAGADAYINIVCASYAAISDIAEVCVCMYGTTNDDYCSLIRGTKVRKMHTSRRDAFRSINELPIAKIWPTGTIEIVNNNFRKRSDKKILMDIKIENKVALLKVYPGSDPSVLDFYIKKGYKGFVIEGTGLGHVPTNGKNSWIPKIKALIKKGIPVVVTSQCIYGRVHEEVYSNLRVLFNDAGAISSEDMTPETSYIKLCWILGHTKKIDEIRKLVKTNLAGEITDRTDIEAFLC